MAGRRVWDPENGGSIPPPRPLPPAPPASLSHAPDAAAPIRPSTAGALPSGRATGISLTVTETRPYRTLDRDNPRCLACGIAMLPEQPNDCPDPACESGYLNEGAPILETWPEYLFTEPDAENSVPALVEANNGVIWDWCEENQVYEEDHPLDKHSCRYYAAEGRILHPVRDIYL